jgi:hypothetical protein
MSLKSNLHTHKINFKKYLNYIEFNILTKWNIKLLKVILKYLIREYLLSKYNFITSKSKGSRTIIESLLNKNNILIFI